MSEEKKYTEFYRGFEVATGLSVDDLPDTGWVDWYIFSDDTYADGIRAGEEFNDNPDEFAEDNF